MNFLLSNYQPIKTPFPTFADAFYDLLPQTEQLDIAVGYITADSLVELKKAIELNNVHKMNLIIGMHYFDLFTPIEYKTAIQLNQFLVENDIGEVRLVTPFRFHGKLYAFHKQNKTIAGIIGSNNLSSIVDSRNGIYESSLLLSEPTTLQQLNSFICELKNKATERISEVPIANFKTNNLLLEGQEFVKKATQEEMTACLASRTETVFDIPIKDAPLSNLNVFFGKGRETKCTGVVKPRHWYEVEIIVPKNITSLPDYPKALTETAAFDVITDDGWKFKCKVSGDYSKNFRSEGDLRVLGKWLKGRLENAGALAVGEQVTQTILREYGRSAFSMTKTTIPNLWYLDFGVR